MPKRKKIDHRALVKMVEDGKPQNEIMETFDFKNSSQLKVTYLNALTELGKVPEIVSERGLKPAAPRKEITVNKRGSLIIPRDLVEDLGFEEGESFTVRKTKAGVSLRRIEEEEEQEDTAEAEYSV